MSYCRFSDDDYQCDVYCYYDCHDNYVIHVAAWCNVYAEPLPITVDLSDTYAYLDRHQKIIDLLQAAQREPIGLPCDGMSFEFEDAMDAINKLIELREIGYRIPNYAINSLKEEIVNVT